MFYSQLYFQGLEQYLATVGAVLVAAKCMGFLGLGKYNGNFYVYMLLNFPKTVPLQLCKIIKTNHRKKGMVPFCISLYAGRTKSTNNLFISYSLTTEKDGCKHIYFYEAMRQRTRTHWNGQDDIFSGCVSMSHTESLQFRTFFNHFISSCYFVIFAKPKRGDSFVVTQSYCYIYLTFLFYSYP